MGKGGPHYRPCPHCPNNKTNNPSPKGSFPTKDGRNNVFGKSEPENQNTNSDSKSLDSYYYDDHIHGALEN